MNRCFIALNGDDVGADIGNAIATDNHDELSNITNSINESHGMIENWIESIGGKKIISNGDEGVYEIPSESCGELENIRQQYSDMSGKTLTVGVGSTMSEASKALIYGKLNNKNQIVEYDPRIDDFLSDFDEEGLSEIPNYKDVEDNKEEELEEAEGIDAREDVEAIDDKIKGGKADDKESEDFDQEDLAVGTEVEREHTDDPEEAQEIAMDHLDEENEYYDEGGEAAGKDLGEEIDDIREDLPKDYNEDLEDEDLEDEDLEDEDLEELSPEDEDLEDEDLEELSPEDVAGGKLDEEPEEANDYNNLVDMIHGHMEGDGIAEIEEDQEELRSNIMSSLTTFKNNRHILESMKESNPELYTSVLTMIQGMIQMAKQLNFNPDEEIEQDEAEDQLYNEFPEVENEEKPEEAEKVDIKKKPINLR